MLVTVTVNTAIIRNLLKFISKFLAIYNTGLHRKNLLIQQNNFVNLTK